MTERNDAEAAEEANDPPPPKFSIPIHALMDANQTSHGLRHDDYRQYHAYCTRRLSRLRHAQSVKKDMIHSAQYVQGEKMRRHVYLSRKKHQPEVLYDERFLLVVLLGAERAWAHCNEIKAMGSSASSGDQRRLVGPALNEKSRSSASKVRQHALRRLKRAVQLANELEAMAKRAADDRTILEAQAYGGWMRGNWSLEVGDWKTACEEFGSAISTCRTLSQTSEDGPENLELRDLFTARADNVLKPLLRYCQYELREAGGTVELQDTAPELAQETSATTTKAGGTISFRGHDLVVENKNLRVTLLKVEGLVVDIKENPSDETKFLQLLTTYDDAIAIVSADLKRYESMKSGPAVNAKRFEMSGLLGHVKFEKLKLLMGRNETMVHQLRNDLDAEADHSPKRLEEIAHLYDALLQDARAVCTLPGGEDDQEDEFVLEAKANVLRVRALRCYFVGRLYETSHKHAEALTLLKQASLLASRAIEEIAACEDMAKADLYLEELEDLDMLVKGATCRVQAQAHVAKSSSGASTSAGTDRSLLERLHDFDAGSSGNRGLADVPPSLIPMPCKPTFFDVAWNHVGRFPLEELDKHIEEHKPQESSKGLLGWFRS